MEAHSQKDLLRHAEFVRRLAHALVGADLADDVVQETYLTALRRPPAATGSARSWLAAVARNAARMLQRANARRRRHETSTARLDRAAPTHDAVARIEIHRVVVTEVLALDEPYRTAVILRYFEDLPPREIARRMHAPVPTVRARLRRALERLRGRMDASCGGRQAWSVALLPLALPGRAAALTAGATVVSKKAAVLLVAWGVLATGLFVDARFLREPARVPERADPWRGRDPAVRRDRPGTAARTGGPERSATEEMARFRQRWLGSRTGRLRGQLVDRRTRKPIEAAVEVRLSGVLPDKTTVEYETRTDASGAFELPDARYPLSYALELRAPEAGIDVKVNAWFPEREQAAAIGVRLVRRLSGVVTDAGGRRVPRAVVLLVYRRGETDDWIGRFPVEMGEDGTFLTSAIDRVPQDAETRVIAAGPGCRPAWGTVVQRRAYLYETHPVLARGALVRGALRRPDGAPAAATKVQLIARRSYEKGRPPDEPDRALLTVIGGLQASDGRGPRTLEYKAVDFKTGADGSFESWFVFPPEDAWLVVPLPDGRVWMREIEGVGGNPDGVFDLGELALPRAVPPGTLTVVDGEGRPIPGIELSLDDLDAPLSFLSSKGRLKADERGVVRSARLQPGRRYAGWGRRPNSGFGVTVAEFTFREAMTVEAK